MKLTTMTQVTVDGVVQGNGGASDEDRRSGFERGGWARGAGDNETRTLITQTYQRADAFLEVQDPPAVETGSTSAAPSAAAARQKGFVRKIRQIYPQGGTGRLPFDHGVQIPDDSDALSSSSRTLGQRHGPAPWTWRASRARPCIRRGAAMGHGPAIQQSAKPFAPVTVPPQGHGCLPRVAAARAVVRGI